MKRIIAALFLAASFVSGAAELTSEGRKELYREFVVFCGKGTLSEILALIDRSYSYDNTKEQPPTFWYRDHLFRKSVSRLWFSGISPNQLLPQMAAKLQTPQARFELYNTYVQVLVERLNENSPEKIDRRIAALENELDNLNGMLAAEKIARDKYEAEMKRINADIAVWKREKANARDPGDVAWEYFRIFLRDESIPPKIAYYALSAAAELYNRGLTPEKAQKILDILSIKFGDAVPDPELEWRMVGLKIDALLELGRVEEALPLIEQNSTSPQNQDVVIPR